MCQPLSVYSRISFTCSKEIPHLQLLFIVAEEISYFPHCLFEYLDPGQIDYAEMIRLSPVETAAVDQEDLFIPEKIKGVLADMVACIKELVLDGKNVKLDDLAIFSVGIESDHGAATAAEFKVSEHVKGLKLRARATGELSNAKINLEGTLRELTQYYLGDETAGGGITPDDDEEEDNDPSGDGETGGDDGVTEDPLV